MSVEIIKSKIRDVVDFPQKGIVFRDLTTVFKDANCLRELSDMLTAIYAEKGYYESSGYRVSRFYYGAYIGDAYRSRIRAYAQTGKTSC